MRMKFRMNLKRSQPTSERESKEEKKQRDPSYLKVSNGSYQVYRYTVSNVLSSMPRWPPPCKARTRQGCLLLVTTHNFPIIPASSWLTSYFVRSGGYLLPYGRIPAQEVPYKDKQNEFLLADKDKWHNTVKFCPSKIQTTDQALHTGFFSWDTNIRNLWQF